MNDSYGAYHAVNCCAGNCGGHAHKSGAAVNSQLPFIMDSNRSICPECGSATYGRVGRVMFEERRRMFGLVKEQVPARVEWRA